jgi:hypothetical protein
MMFRTLVRPFQSGSVEQGPGRERLVTTGTGVLVRDVDTRLPAGPRGGFE